MASTSELEAMESALVQGKYQHRGAYRDDMLGFKEADLQSLLEKRCAALKIDPAKVQGRAHAESGAGDGELVVKAGLPAWLAKFQMAAARSPNWGRDEQCMSRLMGAFYHAYFNDKIYGPKGMVMPASVAVFLEHLGKSKASRPPPSAYVGNGRAVDLGGGEYSYCASSSSEALRRGLAAHGYKLTASGYFPPERGKPNGIGAPVKLVAGGKRGVPPPQPGDVLSIRTATGPLSGHVVTVVFAEMDGTHSGEIIYVSGNAWHNAIACDFVDVVPLQGEDWKPPRRHVAIINITNDSAVQPHALDKLKTLPAGIVRAPGKHAPQGAASAGSKDTATVAKATPKKTVVKDAPSTKSHEQEGSAPAPMKVALQSPLLSKVKSFVEIAARKKEKIGPGASGDAVGDLQTALKEVGMTIKRDRIFGPTTTSVMKKFQKENDVPVTGALDLPTLVKLDELLVRRGRAA